MNPVLIIGCGDIGVRVASLCRPAPVTGIVRSHDSVQRLRAAGIEALRLDLDDLNSTITLPGAGREVYYFAPPQSEGDSDLRVAAVCEIMQGEHSPRRLVYISTTAVYGDCGGEWIDEGAPLRPGSARGKRRLDAERRLFAWGEATGVPVIVLRVPGIYGPGRLPEERLRRGLPVLQVSDSPFTNRIHSEDLARICVAAMQRGQAGEAYNVSDGHPSTMTEYFFQVADVLGIERPPVVDRATAQQVLSPGMLSFLSESKRIENQRMLDELGVELHYETLAAGLTAIVSSS